MKDILDVLGINFNQLVVLILVLVFSAIAIRLTITLDLNKYFKDRKETKLNKLRNACTHHRVMKQDDQYGLQSLFISPPGTVQWQCQQCGLVRYFGDGELEMMTKYYLDNFEEFAIDQKKFQKLLKKNGMM